MCWMDDMCPGISHHLHIGATHENCDRYIEGYTTYGKYDKGHVIKHSTHYICYNVDHHVFRATPLIMTDLFYLLDFLR